jgi:hypothetical protein
MVVAGFGQSTMDVMVWCFRTSVCSCVFLDDGLLTIQLLTVHQESDDILEEAHLHDRLQLGLLTEWESSQRTPSLVHHPRVTEEEVASRMYPTLGCILHVRDGLA